MRHKKKLSSSSGGGPRIFVWRGQTQINGWTLGSNPKLSYGRVLEVHPGFLCGFRKRSLKVWASFESGRAHLIGVFPQYHVCRSAPVPKSPKSHPKTMLNTYSNENNDIITENYPKSLSKRNNSPGHILGPCQWVTFFYLGRVQKKIYKNHTKKMKCIYI